MGPPPIASPFLESPIAVNRRIQRGRNRSSRDQVPESPIRNWGRNPISAEEMDQWIDLEAIHSGDDLTSGSSHGDDDPESESDRLFLQELPETQMPLSYDQTLAYRQSLLTQHPRGKAPVFANRPVRRGQFAGGWGSGARQQRAILSSPSADTVPDEYALGSFVVDDDAEISFAGNSSEV
jgi:ATP-dependent DNA helicase MPH1